MTYTHAHEMRIFLSILYLTYFQEQRTAQFRLIQPEKLPLQATPTYISEINHSYETEYIQFIAETLFLLFSNRTTVSTSRVSEKWLSLEQYVSVSCTQFIADSGFTFPKQNYCVYQSCVREVVKFRIVRGCLLDGSLSCLALVCLLTYIMSHM